MFNGGLERTQALRYGGNVFRCCKNRKDIALLTEGDSARGVIL